MNLVIDLANYTVVPSAKQAVDMWQLGVRKAIVGTSFGGRSGPQINALSGAGIECEEYQFPHALLATTRPWWVDCETPEATQVRTRDALRRGARGVYTRRGWWTAEIADWNIKAEFPDAELWDARYVHGDGPCKIAEAVGRDSGIAEAVAEEFSWLSPFEPYGGFEEASITQWHNSIKIYGLNVDLNEEVEMVTKGEFAALFKFTMDIRDALFGVAKYVVKDKAEDDAEAAELLKRIEALEAEK